MDSMRLRISAIMLVLHRGSDMKNEDVTGILKDVQHLWLKWRDNIPERHSPDWDLIIGEASKIISDYGTHMTYKVINSRIEIVEESIASPVVDWFIDLLDRRLRENEEALKYTE